MTVDVEVGTTAPALSVRGAQKHYGNVVALAGVDLDVWPGRVTAVLGENGAGKSTLMRILAGQERPDGGTMQVDGEDAAFSTVQDARARGIAIVSQELALFPDLDVLDNLFTWGGARRLGLQDRREMARQAKPVLDSIGLRVPLNAPLSSLRLGERQFIEIARALLQDSKVLILDEPNSALNAAETELLFAAIERLRADGVGIVFITHRLEEAFRIADEIVVMRGGVVASRGTTRETSIPEAIRDMVGHDVVRAARVAAEVPESARASELVVDGLAAGTDLTEVSFVVRSGEVIGLAGLEGSGVSTLFDVLFGQKPPHSGTVTLPGGRGHPTSIRDAVRAGVARVQSDRHRAGLAVRQSIADNLAHVTAGALGRYGRWLRLDRMRERAEARRNQLQIKTSDLALAVSSLSGGNQQKVALGKWLEADPSLILLDDPTRGVDVGSKAEIYDIVRSLAAAGQVVLFRSSELLEYPMVCDRVIVLYRGRVCAEFDMATSSERALLEAVNTGHASEQR